MTAGCDDVRAMAAELALDALTGPARAEALEHLDTCERCREEVDGASRVADRLLHLVPSVDPRATFEAAVLERIAGERRAPVVPMRRRSWLPPAIAAAVAALLAITGIVVAGGGSDVRTAELVATSGDVAGQLVIFDDDRMVCVFDDTSEGAAWSVEVVDGDRVHAVGRFEAPGGEWAWTVHLPTDGGDIDEVVVRAGSGQVLATGRP